MAVNQNKNALIKCEHCGEYYSVTYKECPFCDEFDMEQEGSPQTLPRRGSGGRRLVSNKKGGGYGSGWTLRRILTNLIGVAIILAAIFIVVTKVKPLIDRGHVESPPPSALVTASPSAEPSPSEVVSPSPSEEPSPSAEPSPSPSVTPSAQPSPSIPADQTATGFTLSHTDFSLSNRYPNPITIKVTFHPAGSTGHITWTSSDPDIASVDANGKVSPGTKQGQATITATMAGGATQTCVVRSTVTNGGGASAPSPSPSQNATVSFSLSREDFTLSGRGDKYRITISGTSASATWSSSDNDVATVSSDGTVTAVGRGTCTVTAKIGGSTQKCIVRVSN